MIKTIASLVAILMSQLATADGFFCSARDSELNLAVFNSVGPATRHAEVMILSDPTAEIGRQTIARFFSNQGLLTNVGTRYNAKVDLSFKDSHGPSEMIAGTRLSELSKVDLIVDFNYSNPLQEGEQVEGLMTLTQVDGMTLDLEMDCFRYLKGL